MKPTPESTETEENQNIGETTETIAPLSANEEPSMEEPSISKKTDNTDDIMTATRFMSSVFHPNTFTLPNLLSAPARQPSAAMRSSSQRPGPSGRRPQGPKPHRPRLRNSTRQSDPSVSWRHGIKKARPSQFMAPRGAHPRCGVETTAHGGVSECPYGAWDAFLL